MIVPARRPARAAAAVLLLLAMPAIAGCTTQGLVFVQDDRLEITSPAGRSSVGLPFTVRWRSDNPQAASYMVFVDRAPMAPGKTVEAFGPTDSLNGVYPLPGEPPLTRTELVIDSLPPRGDVPRDRRDRYEVTVVWLDGAGRRVSETADVVTLEVRP